MILIAAIVLSDAKKVLITANSFPVTIIASGSHLLVTDVDTTGDERRFGNLSPVSEGTPYMVSM